MTAARILVIEDSDAIRLAVVTALSAQGFEVSGSADGEDLEARLPRDPPDLVILDVMLPGRDGFELLQVIRRFEHGGRADVDRTRRAHRPAARP